MRFCMYYLDDISLYIYFHIELNKLSFHELWLLFCWSNERYIDTTSGLVQDFIISTNETNLQYKMDETLLHMHLISNKLIL